MSGSLIKKGALACALAFVAGAGLTVARMHFTAGEADFASSAPQPTNFRKAFVPQGKHLSLIQVAVKAELGIPDDESQDVELTGWIRIDQEIAQDLQYKWELPDGVQLVSGSLEDSIPGLKAGETGEVRIIVRGFSKEISKLIVLHGYIVEGDTQIGNSSVLTSRPEDSIEMLSESSIATGVQTASSANAVSAAKRPLLDGPIQR